MPKLAPCALVLAAFAASAQSRGPVVPNFQQPEAQQPAAQPVPKSDDAVELVGPTAAQEARAKAAIEAKARAEAELRAAAEAKVRAEAEAKARAEADAKAKALAEARAAEETKLRVAAEARAKAEAELRAAAEARMKAEAEAAARAKAEDELRAAAQARAAAEAAEKARAEAEARRQADEQLQAVARAAASERQRAADEAKAAAQAAAAERDRVARADAEARAQAAQQLKARAHAEAVEKARAQALAAARRKDEGRCAQKRARKDQDACRAMVAAKYDAPLPSSGAQTETLALAPLVAPAPAPEQPSRTVIAPGAPQRSSALALAERNALLPAASSSGAMIASPPAASPGGAAPAVASGDRAQVRTALLQERDLSSQRTAIPRDESPAHARHAEVRNDLQVGPSSLVLDRLTAVAELAPESVQGGFAYRLALDDSGAAHHLFGVSIESARCESGCGLRWFASGGLSPQAASTYGVERKVASKLGQHTDQLAWSAATAAAGAGWSGSLLSFAADGQVESLSMAYLRNVDAANPARTAGTLTQLRLRGTGTVTSGSFSGSARLAGFTYTGDAPESFQQVPMRGALLDDDQGGLAGAPQAFEARLEGRYESQGGFAAQLSYGYLSYVGPLWSAAHIGTAAVSQRFGHFRLGFGLVVEGETDSKGNSYPTVFGTGTVGAAF